MKTKNNLTVIFDLDGTLADIAPHFGDIYDKLAQEFNFRRIKEGEWEKMRGEKTKEFFKALKVPFAKIPVVLGSLKRIMSESIKSIKAVPGIGATVRFLKEKGCRTGILTSNNRKNAEEFLRNNKLIGLFDFIYCENNFFGKAGAIKKIIKKEKLDKKHIFYVGDEDRDIEASKKTGVKVIAVTWGIGSEKLFSKEKPDFMAKVPKDIISITGFRK